MELILSAPDNRVRGFLAAGHVCTVTGIGEYPAIAGRHGVPIVITGFEPLDILLGLERVLALLEAGEVAVENRYPRAVRGEGNPAAQQRVEAVFEIVDRPWRGIGWVAGGGLQIRERFAELDAERRFEVEIGPCDEPEACRAADVLRGRLRPGDCPEFGRGCTPEHPLGAPMVSSEGACAASHRYRSGLETISV
jgi:hydrogenase expression/formation protein HypD